MNLTGIVNGSSPNAEKGHAREGQSLVQKRISPLTFGSFVRSVVEFNGKDNPGGPLVIKHEIKVFLADAVAGSAARFRAGNDIGQADLEGDAVAG